jgi:hypothetical protein
MLSTVDPPDSFVINAKVCKDNANNKLFRIHKIKHIQSLHIKSQVVFSKQQKTIFKSQIMIKIQ